MASILQVVVHCGWSVSKLMTRSDGSAGYLNGHLLHASIKLAYVSSNFCSYLFYIYMRSLQQDLVLGVSLKSPRFMDRLELKLRLDDPFI